MFRLSEGAFLNDTSEGRALFNFLSFFIAKSSGDETVPEPFIERPFIGSFVSENKHDDLTLWRMYGKENQVEAKGCALTIYKEKFINQLEAKLNKTDTMSQNESKYTFYQVAYLNKTEFIIPDSNKSKTKKFNDLLKDLKSN